MKKIIITADDFGLTDGVSKAIVNLLEVNAISNTNIMICVEGAIERCKNYLLPEFADRAGVHLQITPERHNKTPLSVSPAKEIPSLVDANGFFKPKDHTDVINPEEVLLEWERQILKVIDVLGQKPSHLDCHHGSHRKPELTPVYLELAKKYDIPVRGGKEVGQIDGSSFGVKSTAICEGQWTGQNKNVSFLKEKILEKLDIVNDEVVEVISHPGYCDEELIASSSWNEVRENDYKVLLQLKEEKWLENNSIELTHFNKM